METALAREKAPQRLNSRRGASVASPTYTWSGTPPSRSGRPSRRLQPAASTSPRSPWARWATAMTDMTPQRADLRVDSTLDGGALAGAGSAWRVASRAGPSGGRAAAGGLPAARGARVSQPGGWRPERQAGAATRLPWAELFKCVWRTDVLRCVRCGRADEGARVRHRAPGDPEDS